jgi:predicted TIM-barrel fold metal-dependent hydrolase
MNIDADGHFWPVEFLRHPPSDLSDVPRLVDKIDDKFIVKYPTAGERGVHTALTEYGLRERLQAMREGFYDKQCLLVQPGAITPVLSEKTAGFLCESWNDIVAGIARRDDHFIGAAQIPDYSPDAAAAEAERAVRDLGFRALEIHGKWRAGKNAESRDWYPFFERVNKLDVPIWFHTAGNLRAGYAGLTTIPGADFLKQFPPFVGGLLGFLLHAQVFCAGLVYSGIFEDFPNLKFTLTECDAGWVPSFMDWLDTAYDAGLVRKKEGVLDMFITNPDITDLSMKKKPSQYVKDHFLFTMTTTSGYSMEKLVPFLVNEAGLENNLMVESDFDHAEGSLDIVNRVRDLPNISEEAKNKICGKNAARVLKIDWAPSEFQQAYAS